MDWGRCKRGKLPMGANNPVITSICQTILPVGTGLKLQIISSHLKNVVRTIAYCDWCVISSMVCGGNERFGWMKHSIPKTTLSSLLPIHKELSRLSWLALWRESLQKMKEYEDGFCMRRGNPPNSTKYLLTVWGLGLLVQGDLPPPSGI